VYSPEDPVDQVTSGSAIASRMAEGVKLKIDLLDQFLNLNQEFTLRLVHGGIVSGEW
jgi:hypothetical protein